MTRTKNGAAHLVGSVPLGSVEEVFNVCSHELGNVCSRLPDGEAGGWVNIPAAAFAQTDGIEFATMVKVPGMEGLEFPVFKLKPGVSVAEVSFPQTGYVEIAKRSYEAFEKARAAGKIATGTRFQVSLPTAFATVGFALIPQDLPAIYPRFEAHVLKEVEQICAIIPHQDLAIQWDVAVEVTSVVEPVTPLAKLFSVDDIAHMLKRSCNSVPKDVEVGIHLCYGNPGGKHILEPADLSKLVDLSNRVFALLQRPLNWLHMPVPIARDDEAYFVSLKDLKLPQGTEFYLGLVHPGDGIEGARRRIAAAKKFMPGFGVGTECGLRFFPPESIVSLLALHRAAAALAN